MPDLLVAWKNEKTTAGSRPLRHMGDFLLEAATSERCEGDEFRPDLRVQLTAPDHSLTDSRLTPLGTTVMPQEPFDAPLQQRLEHRGGCWILVCLLGSSNPPVPFYHMHAVTI